MGPCAQRWPLNQSSMTWFKPPAAAGELQKNRFMKMFNLFLWDCSRLSVLSRTCPTKVLNFSLCLPSYLSFAFISPSQFCPYCVFLFCTLTPLSSPPRCREIGMTNLSTQQGLLEGFFHWWRLILSCCHRGRQHSYILLFPHSKHWA